MVRVFFGRVPIVLTRSWLISHDRRLIHVMDRLSFGQPTKSIQIHGQASCAIGAASVPSDTKRGSWHNRKETLHRRGLPEIQIARAPFSLPFGTQT
jgi:hypothetical protein